MPAPPGVENKSAVVERLPSLDDVLREKHRRSFYEFFRYFWPEMDPTGPFIEAPHIKALCDHLQAFYEGTIGNLAIEIGPGYGKSLTSAVAFPAWVWGARNDPGCRFGYSTYADDLTTRDSGRCRDLLRSERYQHLYGHRLQLKKATESYLSTIQGGYRKALSTGGQATGHRFNFWFGDDLLNMREAYSAPERKQMHVHLRAISTRGQMGKPYRRCIIGQRLHEDDAGGYARAQGFTVLCLPTEYDPSRHCTTPIFNDWRTERGQLLFPSGFGPTLVAEAKSELGSTDYSAQHQQLPVPAEGGVLKRRFFKLAPRKSFEYAFCFQSIDTAYTENTNNDTSAVTTWGVGAEGICLLDAWSGRLEMPELIKTVQAQAQRWQPAVVLIEAKANGLSLIQMLQRDPRWCWRVEGVKPTVSKDMRAHAAAPFCERGRVVLPEGESITEDFLRQAEIFPAGKVRDLADSAVQAFLWADASYTFEAAGYEYLGSSSAHNDYDDDAQDDWYR